MIRVVLVFLFVSIAIVSESLPTFNYSPYLDRLEFALIQQDYSSIQDRVNELMSEVYRIQNSILSAFFPVSFHDYVEATSDIVNEEEAYSHFGTLFSKVYENDHNSIVTLTLIYKDPAILQYTELVNNPKLISGLEGLSIVTVGSFYSAIKKKSEDGSFTELNIVLEDDVLLNIYGSHIEEDDLTLCINYIDLKGILNYLKPKR